MVKTNLKKFRRSARSLRRRYESTMFTWYFFGRKHAAKIDPLEIIWIPPSKIDNLISDKKNPFQHPYYVSEVVPGKWDKHYKPLDDYDLYASFKSHFKHGIPWEETNFYKRVVQQISPENPKWNCLNKKQFRKRCESLDELYWKIKQDGYKTQSEIYRSGNHIVRKTNYRNFSPEFNEVSVCIARDGEVMFFDGRHRLTIAKLLELDSIPVRIKARHAVWQSRRDEVANSNKYPLEYDHPDLQNVA